MPVQILTAPPANAQATDMLKVEQTLVALVHVLDVIFHISTTGSSSLSRAGRAISVRPELPRPPASSPVRNR